MPEDAPPDACLVMAVSQDVDHPWPLEVSFVLSAACSNDDVTVRDSLQARWDIDGSGDWDTEFAPELIIDDPPYYLPAGTWSARCEVRDQAGNTDVASQTITLPDWLPDPPDIVAGDIEIRSSLSSVAVDTVAVGEQFSVMLRQRGWMDGAMPSVRVDIFIDGELSGSNEGRPAAPFVGVFPLFGSGGLTIATPGVHEIACVTDAGDAVAETNEDNNRTVRSLVVVESPPPR